MQLATIDQTVDLCTRYWLWLERLKQREIWNLPGTSCNRFQKKCVSSAAWLISCIWYCETYYAWPYHGWCTIVNSIIPWRAISVGLYWWEEILVGTTNMQCTTRISAWSGSLLWLQFSSGLDYTVIWNLCAFLCRWYSTLSCIWTRKEWGSNIA